MTYKTHGHTRYGAWTITTPQYLQFLSLGSRGEQKKNAIQLQRVFPVSIDMDTVFDALLLRLHIPYVGHGHCPAHC